MTGTNGIIPPPNGYLKGLRKLLSKYGILMICDEVMCGLGRTGSWFACNNWDVVPDIITMAKGVTSAHLPLGVVAVSTEIAAHFDEKVYSGGLTYSGHPMCLAVGYATLQVLEEENIIPRTKQMGVYMSKLMHKLKEKHVCIGDVRSVGLFGGIEVVKNRRTKVPLVPYNGSHPAMAAFNAFLREKGIFIYVAGNVVHTNPPLIITEVSVQVYVCECIHRVVY